MLFPQIYLGSPTKVAGLISVKNTAILNLKAEDFGILWMVVEIDRDVEFCGIIVLPATK